MGLTPAICTVLCFMLSACNSTDEPIEEALSNAKPEMIHLSNGDVVVLSDTTTYTVDAAEVDDVVMMSEKASENLFGSVSRASTTGLRAYGFDSQEPETDWKKYLLNNWEKYGVSPAIYVGRYVKVHKNLSIEKGTYAVPADYTSASHLWCPSALYSWWNSCRFLFERTSEHSKMYNSLNYKNLVS